MKEQLYNKQNSEPCNPPGKVTLISEVTTKLLEFQKKNITIERDGKNPHFKSTYTTLNEVLAKVKGELNKMGIVILQLPTRDGLVTKLLDIDSQTEMSSFIPFVGADTAQKIGANITYARRYALVSMLGLEDEDDDGNTASAPIKKATPKSPVDMDSAPDFNL